MNQLHVTPEEAYRIAREGDGYRAALERIAHHEHEGDYAGQVNAMRAIASEAIHTALLALEEEEG